MIKSWWTKVSGAHRSWNLNITVLERKKKLLTKKRKNGSRVFPKNLCGRCGKELTEDDVENAEQSALFRSLCVDQSCRDPIEREKTHWNLISEEEKVQARSAFVRFWTNECMGWGYWITWKSLCFLDNDQSSAPTSWVDEGSLCPVFAATTRSSAPSWNGLNDIETYTMTRNPSIIDGWTRFILSSGANDVEVCKPMFYDNEYTVFWTSVILLLLLGW